MLLLVLLLLLLLGSMKNYYEAIIIPYYLTLSHYSINQQVNTATDDFLGFVPVASVIDEMMMDRKKMSKK